MGHNDKEKQARLLAIKTEALLLQHNLSSPLQGEALFAQMEYELLVERFFSENDVLVAAADIGRAYGDFDFFMRLLEAAGGGGHRGN